MKRDARLVRQTFTLSASLTDKVDKLAQKAKRSRNAMVEILLEQAIAGRERRFQKLHQVLKKIDAAATEEQAAQYDEELTEAIFGPQQRRKKSANSA
jgi:predicted transcriptional regulator